MFVPDKEIMVKAVGDIALFKTIIDSGEDPFEYVKNELNNSDILIGNLEFPFTKNKKKHFIHSYEGYAVNPEYHYLLDSVHFDVLTLANNHIMDWGYEGIKTTQNILKRKGILFTGAGKNLEEAKKPLILEKNGIKVGILAYCKNGIYSAGIKKPGSAQLKVVDVCSDINKLKELVNHIIISVHWGIEFCEYPYPEDIFIAHCFIDSGARIILGHHTHVIQGIEEYKDGLIFYGLGNFIYDPWSERIFVRNFLEKRCTNFIANIRLNKEKIIDYNITPCYIYKNKKTIIITEKKAKEIIEYIKKLSGEIGRTNKLYDQAISNLVEREIRTYLYYFRNKGLYSIWYFIKNIKVKYIKLFIGYLMRKIVRFVLRENKNG